MKKLLIPAACLAALLAASLWFLVRRGPGGGPPPETAVAFKIETFGSGTLLRYADGQTPLRALRWMPPLPGDIQAVQILTQSDRQRVVLFRNGAMMANLLIPRPAGVREGFFNFAELHGAVVVPNDVAVLLYRSADTSSGELPLVIAMDLGSQNPRWVHRASGDRLALGRDSRNDAVFLFGPATILRMPLALQKGERAATTPFRTILKQLEMPEEIKELADLLPTGPWSFLAAHAGGLSSYSGSKGWKHWPTPSGAQLTFADARPTLAQGKGYWWQPFPGSILQVKADGTPVVSFDGTTLAPAEPWARDGALFKLRGADPAGHLWFSLATPSSPSSVATPQTTAPGTDPSEKAWQPEGTDPSTAQSDWNAYCAQGLERLYCWNPERRTLQGNSLPDAWAALTLPPGVNRPVGLQDFRPESGRILLESGPTAWFLSLETLPLVATPRKGQVR